MLLAMKDDPKTRMLKTGRVGRFASMARAGMGSAFGLVAKSSGGIEKAVEGLGGLVRGDAIDDERIRTLTARIPEMKKKMLGERFALPSFMPFLMRAVMGANALLAALGAPESGPLTRLPGR